MKTMTAEAAWKLIAEMGWNKNANSQQMAGFWWTELGVVRMRQLDGFVGSRVSDLYAAVRTYEAEHGDLDIGSDDGMNDLLHHVVGLGHAEFDKAMANPKLLEARYAADDYLESFAYVFLQPDPPRTKVQKETAERQLLETIASVEEQYARVVDAMDIFSRRIKVLNQLAATVKSDRKSA